MEEYFKNLNKQKNSSAQKISISEIQKEDAQSSDPQYLNKQSGTIRGSLNDLLKDDTSFWEISYSEIHIEHQIGESNRNQVYKATWRDQEIAFKQWKNSKETEKFRRQAILMINSRPHQNVVKTYGVCINPSFPLGIAVEYMELGTLKKLLQQQDQKLTFLQMVQIAKDIARGVKHLHHDGIIHQGLRAHNVLVMEGRRGWMCKLCKFGEKDYVEEYMSRGKLSAEIGPLKFMPPEMLQYIIASSSNHSIPQNDSENKSEEVYNSNGSSYGSDAWMFGCTLIEILTQGNDPLPQYNNPVEAAIAVLEGNAKPEIPESCPTSLALIIEKCMETEKQNRPDFTSILKLLEIAEDEIKSNPFY